MIRRKRALLLSCSVILLCMCVIVGGTYALFTDSVTVGGHLQAGTLKVGLTRTALTTRTLDKDGFLQTNSNYPSMSLTGTSTGNAFGITDDTLIVPGSYFDATMKITNGGNVAFEYMVEIRLNSAANALAEQLQVTVTHPDKTTTTKKLSELAGGLKITAGTMSADEKSETFGVKIEFLNLENRVNNQAQTQNASFDVRVSAVQASR